MVNGISPMLNWGKAPKAGGMEATGKGKSEKGIADFAELVPDGKGPPGLKPEGPPTEALQKSRPPGLRDGPPGGKREKAILKFMDSFESEIKIPPQKLVEAMAELPPSLQDQSPVETAASVVDKLDLSDADRDKALGLYVGLLMQLQNIERQEAMPKGMDGAAALIAAKPEALLVSDKSAVVAAKNQGLQAYKDFNGMTEAVVPNEMAVSQADTEGAFAAGLAMQTGEAIPGGEIPEAPVAMEASAESAEPIAMNDAKEIPAGKASGNAKNAGLAAAIAKGTAAGLAAGAAAVKAMEQSGTSAVAAEGFDMKAVSEMSAKNVKNLMQGDVSRAEMKPELQMGATGGALAAIAGGMQKQQAEDQGAQSNLSQQFNFQGETTYEAKPNLGEMGIKESQKLEFKDQLAESLAGVDTGSAGIDKSASFQGITAAVTPDADPSTPPIQQLMNQAQVLLKNGGGEMKVQLNPEGLGTVNLRVALQDGKLSVHMAADHKDTKDMLEGSISELRSSLNAQHFTVDNIKVDVVKGTSTDNNSQNTAGNDKNQQEGSQGQQRQFWQQFQENFGNRSRRDDWMALASNPKIVNEKRYDPLASISSADKANAAPRAAGSQRLNMVA
ncbi:MAG: flagellar hook-length control protein FliK [Bdellovibrionota bacterium]